MIMERIKELWDDAKSAPAKLHARFTIKGETGQSFVERQNYMQIIINEMFLAYKREWFVEYDPVALVAPTYIYGNTEETAPVVIGPSLFQKYSQSTPEGIIINNVPVTSMVPYQGGAVTLTMILSKVQKANNVDKVLKVIESLAGLANPSTPIIPFINYLQVTGSIMDGVRTLMNLPETKPLLGYAETINPQVGQRLEPIYLLLIDADQSEIKKEWIQVRDSRLYYGPTKEETMPYRQHDFILLQITQGSKRTDERTLPFYPLWEKTRELAAKASDEHFWDEAKSHFNALKRSLLNSPDLTRPDYRRLKDEYLAEIKILRLEAVNEANLGAKGKLNEDEVEMRRVANELDELDEL